MEDQDLQELSLKMLLLSKSEVPFTITYKVLMSSFTKHRVSVSAEGNSRVKGTLWEIYTNPVDHAHYHITHTKTVLDACNTYRNALSDASNEPRSQEYITDRKLLASYTDDEFDLWFTLQLDHKFNFTTDIRASPSCPDGTKRMLSEGSVDASAMWNAMESAVSYVFFVAFMHTRDSVPEAVCAVKPEAARDAKPEAARDAKPEANRRVLRSRAKSRKAIGLRGVKH